ncbi:MAG: AAA family ATPase [Bacteroidales bacterium]|nr:AAA family ATPase [Candidatus Liminaster caballi]
MKQRIQSLLKQLSQGVFEKDSELALSLLAALSGQSILLLGPPGVAKSMVARRLKYAFTRARSFEYLMSRFSTPDEIFGPVSISRLKDSDRYERCVDGYLPTADVVFLDEIWKAGPAIQNTLLTVINEKTYLNGQTQLRLPLKLLIGASNELPTEGEGLEALYDRFILRLVSQPVRNEDNFYSMLRMKGSQGEDSLPAADQLSSLAFGEDEYESLQRQIDDVEIPDDVLHAITAIRNALKDVKIEGQDVHRQLYVSDRRWTRIARLLRTSALLHDRTSVSLADLQVAVHCLWSEPDEIPAVSRIVAEAVFNLYQHQLDAINAAVTRQMRLLKVRESAQLAREHGDHRDDALVLFDGFYFAVDDGCTSINGMPLTYIPASEFRSMANHRMDQPAVRGLMYNDPSAPKRRVIRPFSNPDNIGVYDAELTRVNIYRDASNIYINGVRYPMKRALTASAQQVVTGLEPRTSIGETDIEKFEQMVDDIFVSANTLHIQLKQHLFVSDDVAKTVSGHMDSFRRQVAQLRADVRLLIYGE